MYRQTDELHVRHIKAVDEVRDRLDVAHPRDEDQHAQAVPAHGRGDRRSKVVQLVHGGVRRCVLALRPFAVVVDVSGEAGVARSQVQCGREVLDEVLLDGKAPRADVDGGLEVAGFGIRKLVNA